MIIKAGIEDAEILSEVGAETFIDSHKVTAPEHEIDSYVQEKYSVDFLRKELSDLVNIYHIIQHDNKIAGFSKMELSIKHPSISIDPVSKMDQLYLLNSFHGLKLGAELLEYNIELSKSKNEKGIWLIVWIGNEKAITFYKKFGFAIVTRAVFQLTKTHRNPCFIMLLDYSVK